MNNAYFKNFGIWLGAPLFLAYLLPYLGVYSMILPYLIVLGGTITGAIMTQKQIGERLNFGKAVGASFLMIGAIFALFTLIGIISYGMPPMWYFIEFMLMQIIIQLVIALGILMWIGAYYAFQKAGKEGWEVFVPIYNFIVMLDIAKKPTWWIAMFFVPIANIVFLIMMLDGISKNFGKTSGFTVGLFFLNQIFWAILGYGDAVYMDTNNANRTSEELLDN